jgi:hypothetical protein
VDAGGVPQQRLCFETLRKPLGLLEFRLELFTLLNGDAGRAVSEENAPGRWRLSQTKSMIDLPRQIHLIAVFSVFPSVVFWAKTVISPRPGTATTYWVLTPLKDASTTRPGPTWGRWNQILVCHGAARLFLGELPP